MSRAATSAVQRGSRERLRLDVTGAVQGVGFRPFVHRLAVGEGLGGFVRNTGAGVTLEIEGAQTAIRRFMHRLDAEIVPPASIDTRRTRTLAPRGESDFVIAPSACGETPSATVLPDLATCPDCLREILDADDRRHRYPFTTCMHCGPRYSLIEAVPYDRERTTMRHFPMCPACRAEYEDPASRRFHAETNACPDCGPRLSMWDARGEVLAQDGAALSLAADALRSGRIVALKGLGGFQLLADARNAAAVRTLRERKRRPAKPFAVMAPTPDDVRALADVSIGESKLLCSAAAPIVLLRAHPGRRAIAAEVAPDNPYLGIMLPTTPLHHLLMSELGFPVVATSGNRGDEPIVTDEREALKRLQGLADVFLVHDRPILRPVDDSVVRVLDGQAMVLRRARGYAPLTLHVASARVPTLALGGHQKNSVAVAAHGRIVLGPHIGDLGNSESRDAFARGIETLSTLYDIHPQVVACDLHPDYHSSHVAERLGLPVRRVPHHLAHVLAGIADNGIEGAVLGVAWDGSGYGEDGTLWGGEFLVVDGASHRRIAHLHPFRLPGGEAAMREPRRSALGVLHALHGESALTMHALAPVAAFTPSERRVLAQVLARGVNAPLTSSAGRLFDAVAAILELKQVATFEGEAAMAVEFAAGRAGRPASLSRPVLESCDGKLLVDWRPTLDALVEAHMDGADADSLAAGFHVALASAIVDVAVRSEARQVLLTGGCFQNAHLARAAEHGLREAGLTSFRHRRIPPNDGGLAVGQALYAACSSIEDCR